MRRIVLVAALALALAGCRAVGPDYHLPAGATANLPAANAPFDAGHEAAFDQAPLPDHWWRLYQDPRLDALVERALAANADLRAAEANLREAIAVVGEARAMRTPATTLSGGVSYARSEALPVETSPAVGYDLAGNISYPVDLFGGLRRGIEAAKASADAAQAARDEVRVTVAAGVARSYVAACSANKTAAAVREVLAIQQATYDSEVRLFKGGRATAFDVTRAQAAVRQSAAELPGFLAQRQAALYQLGALLGAPPSQYPRELESCMTPPTLARPLPIGDGAALIRRRPDIREAERMLAAATAKIGVETAALYPEVTLGGSVGSSGPVSGFASNRSFGFSLGPLISWTFPNRSIAHARIAEAGAAAEAASASFDSTVIDALQQTETALSAYARDIDSRNDLALARDSSRTAADQAGRLYRFGRGDFLDLLTAQGTLASAQLALAQSDASLADAQVQLFQSLGGGWQP